MLSKNLWRIATLSLGILMTGTIVSCGEDDGNDPTGPIASFVSVPNQENFLEVTFENVSQNATSYSWDFGDMTGTSTEESPTYSYAESGTYTVVLTASDGTDSDDFSADVTIVDPDEALTLLAGTDSKTWKLLRDGTAMLLTSGPDPTADGYAVYWPGSSNNGQRPCLYDDEFTFGRDGS
ncbi:MAG: PKD domain-containing protein, partial [Ekhidna sp.]